MIRAILTDFEGTLVSGPDGSLFGQSMSQFASWMGDLMAPEAFALEALAALQTSRANTDPLVTADEAFFRDLSRRLDCPPNVLVSVFQKFYENGLGESRPWAEPLPLAPELVGWLLDSRYTVILATDHPIDRISEQYLQLSGLLPHPAPSRTVQSLKRIHFGKPNPCYFEEILATFDLRPEEALMVGDDWQADIQSAARAGLNTFWITHDASPERGPQSGHAPDGQGTLPDFLRLARDEQWLGGLKPRQRESADQLTCLLGTVAAIDSLLREIEPELWAYQPDAQTWSMRDAICHLRDHEIEVDQPRLTQVLDEDNAFISATNYDPQHHAHEYPTQDAREALQVFAERRTRTISMLEGLPPTAWTRKARHSIFGPTTFGELVKFMADHDRIHLRQMRDAVAAARQHGK